MNVEEVIGVYCDVDDFVKKFLSEWEKHLLAAGTSRRGPKSKLTISEIITVVILFHISNYRTFKHFYHYMQENWRKDFPDLVSYSRFVYLQKRVFVPLFAYLIHRQGRITGIAFIDATSIAVCHNKRIYKNRVFRGLAKRGKTTTGWFYGLKLHLLVNDQGEILSFQLTPGNIADVSMAETLTRNYYGKVFGDKGYISKNLFQSLLKRGVHLFTKLRSNMKNKLIKMEDKILLRKRCIIETINDQLKNISQIEHTRHRSPANFLINLLSGLAAYSHQPKKPSLRITPHDCIMSVA